MMRNCLFFGLLAILLLVCSCHSNKQEQASCNDVKELPLPEVPSSLTTPEERAAYILAHFWDGMDFRDTLRSHDTAFMEQGFVNFLSLFPHVRNETLPTCIGKFLERVVADSVTLRTVNDLAEHYLDDPNSPMRNEEYYILYLEELLRLPELPEHYRTRSAYRLETAGKNRPGTVATDFSYTDRDGNRRTLHGTRGKRLLLLFYDPACSHCSEILDEIHDSPLITGLVAGKELSVLAVYTEGDRKLWNETKASMPKEWSVAIDESRIVERNLYSLPAMPVIYLLDGDKTVLLKDPSPDVLYEFLYRE